MRFAVVTVLLVGFAALNAHSGGPRQQSPNENYAARHRVCTEERWGWPFPFYHSYGGGGYVNPDEWLAWDVDPIDARWDPGSAAANLLVLAITCVAAYAALPRRRRVARH